MTLDDLEQSKRHSCRKNFYGARQKNSNEDRPIVSGKMILLSRNIRCMRIFAGVPRGGSVNCQTTISVHACVRYFEHEHIFISLFIVVNL